MMKVVTTIAEMRQISEDWRLRRERIALVPTMGNLHAGHMHLVERARELAARVAVSIFVNPLQFGPSEDFANYPRTFEEDQSQLIAHGADVLFAPDVTQMYPRPLAEVTKVSVPVISDLLCGAFRPGHFVGVATVVARLFNLVQPDVALFGEKDYQQLLVIRRMAEDLGFPLEIIGVPTVRDADGLALSSRNRYLADDARQVAPRLYETLCGVADQLRAGANDFPALVRQAQATLQSAGFKPDYVAVRRAADLAPPQAADDELVVLAAAWLGRARLIDNVTVARYGTAD